MPTELPDLRRVDLISIDSETKDDRLRADMGSGWPFRAGYICGVGVAYRADGEVRGRYFPIRHPDSQNFDPDQVYQWVRDHIAAGLRFVTQNGVYDYGWLRTEAGIEMPPGDRLEEIGALATMVDENRFKYSLDALCIWRGLLGKDETLLHQGIETLELAGNKKVKPQSLLWQLPAQYVGPYAEADAINTLRLYESLDPILDQEGTRAAYRLECDILPMVLEMRRRGIRIDLGAAERARDLLLRKRDAALAELSDKLGFAVSMHEIAGKKWLVETFDRLNIKYPHTKKGNASFTSGKTGWMAGHKHWLPQLIATANKYNKVTANHMQPLIDHAVNGRIHAEINPHRSEDNGTKSFRFSYSRPPLQQMPSQDKELAPLIRGVFLPEEKQVWAKPDASQQEFRLVVHYANQHKLRKADEAVARYRDDPDCDFHAFAAAITALDRSAAKAVNFAKIFGAGVEKFAQMIGKPMKDARQIYAQYDRELPFLRRLSDIYKGRACREGFITLYDGARRHFDKFAPGGKWEKHAGPCSLKEAQARQKDPNHPWYQRRPLYRSNTHTALNALIQGSAARHTKLWMRACWREGIVPLLQMHDCLDCSVSSREQAELVARLGCEAVQLDVPMRVDLKYGRNWGDAVHTWDQLCNGAEIHDTIFAGHVGSGAPKITNPRPSYAVESETNHCPPVENSENLESAGKISGKISCVFHKGDDTPSLYLYADGHYHCYGCGAHGDIEELPEATPTAASNTSQRNTDTLKLGTRLWQTAVSIRGTLAERYLTETRKLDLATLPDIDAVLRFHPRCPFDGNRYPCLIALFHDAETDEVAGIHRIALTPNAKKIGRMMLGSWSQPRAIKLRPIGEKLIVGEGVETVIAGGMQIHEAAALWAMGSAAAIGNLPLLPGVTKLMILVDHDKNNVGIDNARNCVKRWSCAKRNCVLLCPHQDDTDFNDLIGAKR
jgi:DNA polymerase I-like protein with 3'-5' exonuclease and polymerase domains